MHRPVGTPSLELQAEQHRECLFGRELDPVCLRGVPTHLCDLALLGPCPEPVAAVAAQCLVSKHFAADTASLRLEAR